MTDQEPEFHVLENQPTDTIVGSAVNEQFGTKPDWLDVSLFSEEYNEFFYIDQDGNIRTNKLDFESDPQHFELQVWFWAVPDGPEGVIVEPQGYTESFYISRDGSGTRVSCLWKTNIDTIVGFSQRPVCTKPLVGSQLFFFRRSTMSFLHRSRR